MACFVKSANRSWVVGLAFTTCVCGRKATSNRKSEVHGINIGLRHQGNSRRGPLSIIERIRRTGHAHLVPLCRHVPPVVALALGYGRRQKRLGICRVESGTQSHPVLRSVHLTGQLQ